MGITGYLQKIAYNHGIIIKNKSSQISDNIISVLYNSNNNWLVRVDLNKVVNRFGFYFKEDWHPFVEYLEEYRNNNINHYNRSSLKKYYERWSPKSVSDIVYWNNNNDNRLDNIPSYAFIPPWSNVSVEEVIKLRKSSAEKENRQQGEKIDYKDGFSFFGPVSHKKGNVEVKRLIDLYNTINNNSYRIYNDTDIPTCYVLRKNGNIIYQLENGNHRLSVLSALGYKSVVMSIKKPIIISIDHLDYWPMIKKGVWDKKSAEIYFNNLFLKRGQKFKKEYMV